MKLTSELLGISEATAQSNKQISDLLRFHKLAQKVSSDKSVVQHINKNVHTGQLYVSDWFDDDETVATYNNGKQTFGKEVNEDVELAKKLVRGEKSAPGILNKIDQFVTWKLFFNKGKNRFLPAKTAVDQLQRAGFNAEQIHLVRDTATKAAFSALETMKTKYPKQIVEPGFHAPLATSFQVFELFLNVSEKIHAEFADLFQKLFDKKIEKVKSQLTLKEGKEEPLTADKLDIGDTVVISGDVEYQDRVGEISSFGTGKKFVVVNLHGGIGNRSFHSSDVTQEMGDHDQEDDDDQDDESDDTRDESEWDSFYVAFYEEDERKSWIGCVTKAEGGKWHEEPHSGEPDYRWGTSYMSYLTPEEVMSWIKKDYRRGYEVEGPFETAEEAEEHAHQNWGHTLEESVDNSKSTLANLEKFAGQKIRAGRNTIKGYPVDIEDGGDEAYIEYVSVDKDAGTGLMKALRAAGFKVKRFDDNNFTVSTGSLSESLDEGFKKLNPKSEVKTSYDRKGRRVKTPDGDGEVTFELKEPTFSQMVPYVHNIYVKLDSGKTESYRNIAVKFVKDSVKESPESKARNAMFLKAAEKADFDRMMHGVMTRDEFNKRWKKGQYAEKSGKYKLDPTGLYHNMIKGVNEAESFTNFDDWKQAVLNSYPTKAKQIKFKGRMEGNKDTISAEVPGEDRSYGVWDQDEEKGVVLSEGMMDDIKAVAKKFGKWLIEPVYGDEYFTDIVNYETLLKKMQEDEMWVRIMATLSNDQLEKAVVLKNVKTPQIKIAAKAELQKRNVKGVVTEGVGKYSPTASANFVVAKTVKGIEYDQDGYDQYGYNELGKDRHGKSEYDYLEDHIESMKNEGVVDKILGGIKHQNNMAKANAKGWGKFGDTMRMGFEYRDAKTPEEKAVLDKKAAKNVRDGNRYRDFADGGKGFNSGRKTTRELKNDETKDKIVSAVKGAAKSIKDKFAVKEGFSPYKLNAKVKITGGPKDVIGKIGSIGEIKTEAGKKTFVVDYDHDEKSGKPNFGMKSISLSSTQIKLVKDTPVKEAKNEQLKVVKKGNPEKVLFTGTLDECKDFMRSHKSLKMDLLYADGQMASFVL